MLSQISFNEDLRADRQIKDRVRYQRDTIDVSNPRGLDTSHNSARHQGVDVAIRQDDETRTQRRHHAILELVRKICCVKQAKSPGAENIPAHRLFKLAADQHRSL